jgi:hypothetical protein
MDQCKHCTLRGNLVECEKTDCTWHELWYVSALKTKEYFDNSSTEANQQLKAKNSLCGSTAYCYCRKDGMCSASTGACTMQREYSAV